MTVDSTSSIGTAVELASYAQHLIGAACVRMRGATLGSVKPCRTSWAGKCKTANTRNDVQEISRGSALVHA